MPEAVVHVVYCPCSEAEVIDRVTGIITEHVASAREGVVPAVLAEVLIDRLKAQSALWFVADLEERD